MNKQPLLKIKNLSASYDGAPILSGIDLTVQAGSIIALMGHNGSGKSTILKAILGMTPHQKGAFAWEGESFKPSIKTSLGLGISYVPQGRQLFKELTVKENIEMGAFSLTDKKLTEKRLDSALKVFPVLNTKLNEKAKNLSGGQQQMVAIARGLMTEPKLLLLDEPTLGLAPNVVSEVFNVIHELNITKHVAMIIVEHNIKSLLPFADAAYLLEKGKITHRNMAELSDAEVYNKLFL